MRYKIYKNVIKVLLLSIVIISSFSISTFAAGDRDTLREELEQQEEELKNELKPYNPLDKGVTVEKFGNTLDTILENNKDVKGEFSVDNVVITTQKALFEIVIKTRTFAIIAYGLLWLIGIIYAAIMGSRDVNKRRKVFLIIRNCTVLFFVYINIPLFIIWINSDVGRVTQLTFFNVVFNIMEFLQKNSLIIAVLLLFAGVTRLIISRNDLPVRKQGQFLIKFAIISLIALNVAPLAMSFLI